MKNIILFVLSLFLLGCPKNDDCSTCPSPIDTTSHNFIISRIDTLGDFFSSARCVSVLDENDIWIGGEFYEKDSANNLNLKYNLAHWDGIQWSMIAVPMIGYNNTGPSAEPLRGITVFNDSNIFVFSTANSQAWWNGDKWNSSFVDSKEGYLQHLWAHSQNDIYFCGEYGSITHWNGQVFSKMSTGISTTPLQDIWGDENEVYAVGTGGGGDQGRESLFLFYNGSVWQTINRYDYSDKNPSSPNQYVGIMESVYRKNKNSKLWLLAGTGHGEVFQVESLIPFRAKSVYNIQVFFPGLCIRGNSDNDIFLVSSIEGTIIHYNGISWQQILSGLEGCYIYNFDVKGDIFVSVGHGSGIAHKGLVVIGKRTM